MFWELLESCIVVIVFQVWSSKSNTKNTIWRKLLFWEKYKWQWRLSSHHSAIISIEPKQKITCGNISHEKKIYRSSRSHIFFRIFLKMSQESTYVGVSLCCWVNIKKRLQNKCFPVKSERFLRTRFLQNTSVATSESKHLHASTADLLHIRIGNFDWCKCWHCKNEVRVTDCLCCREVDAMLIASQILKREESISSFSFHVQLPDCQSHVLGLSTK